MSHSAPVPSGCRRGGVDVPASFQRVERGVALAIRDYVDHRAEHQPALAGRDGTVTRLWNSSGASDALTTDATSLAAGGRLKPATVTG